MRPITLARRESIRFARRIVLLVAIVILLLLLGALGLALSEHVGFWYAFRWALDTAATVGSFHQPRTTAGQIVAVRAGHPRHRYALLRSRDGRGAVRSPGHLADRSRCDARRR